MKTEREIREHRDALRRCRNLPCGCTAEGHAHECQVGGRMMDASIGVLSWVLGEGEDQQRLVDAINEEAARARAGI